MLIEEGLRYANTGDSDMLIEERLRCAHRGETQMCS